MRLAIVVALLTVARLASAQHLHPDMAHLPDFTKDPKNATRVVTGAETISGGVHENIVVNAGASLTLSGSIDLITLMTHPGSTLTLTPGTTVWYRDVPLDTEFDPDQLGHGAVILGKVRSLGTAKTSWVRLAKEPKAGDTVIAFGAAVTGWKVGDEVVFGDSDQCATDDLIDFTLQKRCRENHTEHRWLTSIATNGIGGTLNLPLTYNHPGGRIPSPDGAGTVLAMPFVSNHTRDIRFISRNPNGVRGHLMVSNTADVDIEYTEFTSGGRTCSDAKADNTVWVDGVATHIGTCQKGRYPLHMHRVGRGVPPKIIGNAINDCGVWCLAIHDTHFGTFRQNVFTNSVGAGLVTEDGNETENIIDGNLGVHIIGTKVAIEDDDIRGTVARTGSCMWFAGPNNYVTNNVCVDALDGYKFIIGVSSGLTQRCPKLPGGDPMNPDQGVDCAPNKQEVRRFDGNSSWRAMNVGTFFYQVNTIDQTVIHPFTVNGLELVYNHEGLRIGNIDSLTLNDLVCISGYKVNTGRLVCVQLDQNTQFTANRFDVFGTRVAFAALQPGYANLFEPNFFRLNGKRADGSRSRIDASIGAAVEFDNHNQPHGTQTEGDVSVRDVDMTADNTGGSVPYYFYPVSRIQDGMDVTVKRKWLNFNVSIDGAAPRDSEVFAPESGPDKPMPTTGDWTDPATGTTWHKILGTDTPGLTNAQSWAQDMLAFNGGVACPTTNPKVYGYYCPQGGVPPPVPTVTSVTVTGQTAYTAVAQNAQMTATAKFSDNTTANVTDSAAWQSSNPMVAAISSAGLVTTRAAGTATVSATAAGKTGTLAITVTVVPPTPTPVACTGTLTGTAPNGGTFKCVPGQACPVTPAGTTWICQ